MILTKFIHSDEQSLLVTSDGQGKVAPVIVHIGHALVQIGIPQIVGFGIVPEYAFYLLITGLGVFIITHFFKGYAQVLVGRNQFLMVWPQFPFPDHNHLPIYVYGFRIPFRTKQCRPHIDVHRTQRGVFRPVSTASPINGFL